RSAVITTCRKKTSCSDPASSHHEKNGRPSGRPFAFARTLPAAIAPLIDAHAVLPSAQADPGTKATTGAVQDALRHISQRRP
ncbi:MAG: hypothetical protein P8N68_16125, partial [Paracoccaceae bacterium]|nr:hypothetical protein [Paracoccaceae bacterium]